jgi:nucleotide-binding universal stress UspA family protein
MTEEIRSGEVIDEQAVKEEAEKLLPTKILVACDDSESAAFASRITGEIAEMTGSEVHLLYVYPLLSIAQSPVLDERKRREAQSLLDEHVSRIEEHGKLAETYLRVGRPDEEIIKLADELKSNLIILGEKGAGALRKIIGNVHENVVRRAGCPVLVARRPEPPRQPSRSMMRRL